jgi:isopentenyl diphosphate isomerase/L-lactate dehydrogenase-like FMN-dependent dehydrogenase
VERVLAIFRDEIDRVMGLLGARTLPEIRQLEALVPHDPD